MDSLGFVVGFFSTLCEAASRAQYITHLIHYYCNIGRAWFAQFALSVRAYCKHLLEHVVCKPAQTAANHCGCLRAGFPLCRDVRCP